MSSEETLHIGSQPEAGRAERAPNGVTRIEPSPRRSPLALLDVWRTRETIFMLVSRDIRVRYKQSLIGVGWAVLQPFLTMVVFTVIFGKYAQFPSQGLPYQVFVYTGLLPWTLFASALTLASMSVVSNRTLVSKVYFPRLSLPVAAVLVPFVDFVFALIVLFGIMAWFGVWLQPTAVLAPVFLVCLVVSALGVGCFFATLNARYRDVPYAVPFLVQIWLFLSPVIYPSGELPSAWQWIVSLNPAVFAITGFRWALTGTPAPDTLELTLGVTSMLVFFFVGLLIFRRYERRFADIL